MLKAALMCLLLLFTSCTAPSPAEPLRAAPSPAAPLRAAPSVDGAKESAIPKTQFHADEKIYDVPVVMYHHVNAFGKGKYSVTPETFENDLLWLKERGFETVTVSELAAFTSGKNFKMPRKPVVLTFDDGRYNNYTQVLPLLKKHDCKASFFIIGLFAQRSSDGRRQYEGSSYLNFGNIREMAESGLCDIQSHTYDLHDWTKGRVGAGKKKDESFEDYKKALLADHAKNCRLLSQNCGVTPCALAYPFGAYNEDTEKIFAEAGVSAILTTDCGVNKIGQTGGDGLLRLKRANRDPDTTSGEFFKANYPQVFDSY